VQLLEALKILEDATLDCKGRNIDTPEVREALETIDPYCLPRWRVKRFREHLHPHPGEFGPDTEGQQQALRVCFSGIYASIRDVLCAQVVALWNRYQKSRDYRTKAEVERLAKALKKMPKRWEFHVRK
jgi:hypothetical protein